MDNPATHSIQTIDQRLAARASEWMEAEPKDHHGIRHAIDRLLDKRLQWMAIRDGKPLPC